MHWEATNELKHVDGVLHQKWELISHGNDGHGGLKEIVNKTEWRKV